MKWKMKTVLVRILLVSLFISPLIRAEEADKPDFNGAPIAFEQTQNITMFRENGPESRMVVNQVLVGHEKDDQLPFWVYIQGPNLHICSLSGNANKDRRGRYIFKQGNCRLTLTMRAGKLALTDYRDGCAALYCAAPAVIGKSTFQKSSK